MLPTSAALRVVVSWFSSARSVVSTHSRASASGSVPSALTHYLSDIEPGYTTAVSPVREVYNHGWLIGDESAISALAQAELDTVLEIAPRQSSPGEQSVAEAE